jgi:MtN3 and saliva related transmembrane protein
MNYTELLGYSAGILNLISFLPQIFKIVNTRSTNDISLVMYLFYILGTCLWTFYGIIKKSGPIVVVNLIAFILVIFILILKIYCEYFNKKDC